MSKISVELSKGSQGYISEAVLTSVTSGCLRTLDRLGKIGKMIEAFKITFTSFPGWGLLDSGPVFTIYFRDPLGTTSSHVTDFRFIRGKSGEKKPTTRPSTDDIADHLCEVLRSNLLEHARNAQERLAEMATKLTEYIGSKP